MLANNTTEVVKEIPKFMVEVFCLILLKIQWALLNKITDYGINWLMGPNLYHTSCCTQRCIGFLVFLKTLPLTNLTLT
jgi:hypothetical protein